jgi:hypothetical protein
MPSTFGGFGIIATDFLTNYQTALRLVSIAILLWALYSVHNKITKSCIFNRLPTNKSQSKTTTSSSSATTTASRKLEKDRLWIGIWVPTAEK